MRVRIATVRFISNGFVDCRKCHRRTTFPDGASLLIYDYGTVQVIRSANSKAVLHECGQEFFWQCDSCGGEPNLTILAKHLRARRKYVLRCTCGGEFTQHRLEVVDDQPEEVEYAVTPF